MKKETNENVYETSFTALAATLSTLGFDLIGKLDDNGKLVTGATKGDAIRRIFTESKPCNYSVAYGKDRGGVVEFRFEVRSTEFDTPIEKVAQAFCDEESEREGKSAEFDEMLKSLQKSLKGTAAGIELEKIIAEFPCEIARYNRFNMENTQELRNQIYTRKGMTEMVRIRKADGHSVLHHADCPEQLVKELCEY